MFAFQELAYQRDAVAAVVDAFADPARRGPVPSARVASVKTLAGELRLDYMDERIYANAPAADPERILANVREIQKRAGLPLSPVLRPDPEMRCGVCLDVEMETGTGKTYVYLRTMLELHARYGWDHFILTVPTIAIRQGVLAALKGMRAHFADALQAEIALFSYDSANAETLAKTYCGKAAEGRVHLLLLNAQKFNKALNIIHAPREQLGGESVAQCVAKTHPVVFIDEPQKQSGAKTLAGLGAFRPLAAIHYSATHRLHHELVYRLTAQEALARGLVKRVEVAEATTAARGFNGAYLVNRARRQDGKFRIRLGVLKRMAGGGLSTATITPSPGENLGPWVPDFHELYGNYVVQGVDTRTGEVSLAAVSPTVALPKTTLALGEAMNDAFQEELREAQIRVAVERHLEKEQERFARGVKTLTLFFIDRVERYDGPDHGRDGPYARILLRVYRRAVKRKLEELRGIVTAADYAAYLEKTVASDAALARIHGGYFSSDRAAAAGKESEEAKDYEAILNDKEALLRLNADDVTGTDAIRFIFSHSALREGWDNPNVFTICFLKEGGRNEGTLRQEIGRGLRLCVDQTGARVGGALKRLNVLTVVTTRGLADVVEEMQADADNTEAALRNLVKNLVVTADGRRLAEVVKGGDLAILKYLRSEGYLPHGRLSAAFRADYAAGELPPTGFGEPLETYAPVVFAELAKVPTAADDPGAGAARDPVTVARAPGVTEKTPAGQAYRAVIRRLAALVAYRLDYDDDALVADAVTRLKQEKGTLLPRRDVTVLIREAHQEGDGSFSAPSLRRSLAVRRVAEDAAGNRYNLVADVMAKTGLSLATTRKLLAEIWRVADLRECVAYDYDGFTQGVAAAVHAAWQELVCRPEGIDYIRTPDPDDQAQKTFDLLWTPDERHDPGTALKGAFPKHVYSELVVDSAAKDPEKSNEAAFARRMEASPLVLLYAKLPDGFRLPTPVGRYNPDWVVILRPEALESARPDGGLRVYYVCDTKRFGDGKPWQTTTGLKALERGKLRCALKLFERIFAAGEPPVHFTVLDGNYVHGGALGELQEKAEGRWPYDA